MMNDNIGIVGHYLIRQIRDGEEIDRREGKNLIVNKGLEWVAKLINGVETTTFSYIQVGTGTTAAQVTDTALETYNDEVDSTESYEASYKAKLVGTINFTSSVAVTESGVFNGAHTGSPEMLCRQVFSALNMANGDSLEVTWKITVSTS